MIDAIARIQHRRRHEAGGRAHGQGFDANRQGPNVFLTNVHAQTTERIDAEAAVGDWLARGAGLSPDDAFAYAEQQLEATLSQPSDAGDHPPHKAGVMPRTTPPTGNAER